MARLNSWSVYESTWYAWSVHVCSILLCLYAAGLKRAICLKRAIWFSLFLSLSLSSSLSSSSSSSHVMPIYAEHITHTYTRTSQQMMCKFPERERVIRAGKLYYKFCTLSVLYRSVFVLTMSRSFCSICASTRRFSYIWFFRAFSRIQITLSLLFQVVTSSVHSVMSSRTTIRIKRAHVSTICTYLIERGRTHPAKWCARLSN